jgi:hypothetical protein
MKVCKDQAKKTVELRFEVVQPTSYAVWMQPIACTLTEAELRERRRTILDSVRAAALDVTPLPLGYAYRF